MRPVVGKVRYATRYGQVDRAGKPGRFHEITERAWERMVAVYDLGEALANLVQPFWMLPVLALLGLRARDVMGYTFLVFLFLLPTVLVLTLVLGLTLSYPL